MTDNHSAVSTELDLAKAKGRYSANCATPDGQPLKPKIITKLDRVTDLLKTRPEGLTRFEAESFGEHCLNSTAAVIRSIYGDKLIQRWETVPSRFTNRGVRVYRYWLVEGANHG